MSANEDGEDWTGPFMEGLVREKHQGFLTGYVLFATYVNEDGDTCYWGDSMQGQTAVTSLGIVDAMQAIERHRVVAHHFGLPTDE